ncbi:MAG TPA: hypothetical protein DGG94_03865 [Micromonosporaceae bacterium]|nr:hypothetical protein [Micromonosporaceae bacterium]HCU48936.1 hypothetical protein [Micromonosporaceae bacterium]
MLLDANGRRLLTWLLFVTGVVAEIGGTFLLFAGDANFWGIVCGWPVGLLMAWLITKTRRFDKQTTWDVMNRGLLAIFVAPFVQVSNETQVKL